VSSSLDESKNSATTKSENSATNKEWLRVAAAHMENRGGMEARGTGRGAVAALGCLTMVRGGPRVQVGHATRQEGYMGWAFFVPSPSNSHRKQGQRY